MATLIDFEPVADEVSVLVAGVRDDQLVAPTPCPDYSVAALLDHLMALAVAFKLGATKASTSTEGMAELAEESPPGKARAEHLRADWREQLPARLADLSAVWRESDAWEGQAEVGGVTMPSELTAKVALDELVLHGWDLARATGQGFDPDPASVGAALDFASMLSTPGEEAGREGIFGPVVDVPDDAAPLDRLLGLSGRDPGWTTAAGDALLP
jgi:uncharacterized protein (TIGR03086 family)